MDTMSVQEAASYLGVTQKTIYRYLDAHKLSSEKIGLVHFIPRSEVESMALSRHVPTDEKTRLDNRVSTLYELVGALDFRVRELEEKLAKLQASGHVQAVLPTVQTPRHEAQERPVTIAPRPTTPKPDKAPTAPHTTSQGAFPQGNLPAGYVALSEFYHGIARSTAKRNADLTGGDWRDATGHVVNMALSPEQQRTYYEWAHNRPGFVACPECPHET